ncbi:MAG: tRNA uridine-5-carboxymethylaminomethyl(34) synthesis GTPase MnmE [Candidatus Zixiibacteriota bacterium]
MPQRRRSKTTKETGRDLIAAIITPPGEGGIGALRVAGDGALDLCAPVLRWTDSAARPHPFYMKRATLTDTESGEELDDVMAVWMPPGKSYTGDEQVEIFSHGGRVVLRRILQALFDAGARPADPGEFTRRAFLCGRIDLTEAEAVAEIISAKSDFAYRAARDNLFGKTSRLVEQLREKVTRLAALLEANVDFPEEDIETNDYREIRGLCGESQSALRALRDSYTGGAIIRDGFRIALCGRPNAGKSSLFNALLKTHRAIISETPGTTRDYLSEWIQVGDIAVELSDTAGMRDSPGQIESLGQEFSRAIAERAELILWIADVTEADCRRTIPKDLAPGARNYLVVANKIDLLDESDISSLREGADRIALISCKTGAGLDDLEKALENEIQTRLGDQVDGYFVTSERHQQKFSAALTALDHVELGIKENASPELLAFDVRQALNALDEITGRVYTEDLLEVVFSSFCVGK